MYFSKFFEEIETLKNTQEHLKWNENVKSDQ